MNTINLIRKGLILMALLAASYALMNCGLSGGTPNQGLPTGTVISQGSLTPGSCISGTPSVAGTVVMYSQGNNSYAANISGISYTGGGCGVLAVEFLANTYYSCGTLILNGGNGGSQNFTCTLPSTPSQVVFHCTSGLAPPNDDCAVANLTPTS